jgi:hypothetical protein
MCKVTCVFLIKEMAEESIHGQPSSRARGAKRGARIFTMIQAWKPAAVFSGGVLCNRWEKTARGFQALKIPIAIAAEPESEPIRREHLGAAAALPRQHHVVSKPLESNRANRAPIKGTFLIGSIILFSRGVRAQNSIFLFFSFQELLAGFAAGVSSRTLTRCSPRPRYLCALVRTGKLDAEVASGGSRFRSRDWGDTPRHVARD